MIHDAACELGHDRLSRCGWPECWAKVGMHCHCGARAFPLCEGCRDGQHLRHAPVAKDVGKTCACDLCVEEAVA